LQLLDQAKWDQASLVFRGLGTKSNLNDWSAYAKQNSFSQADSKAQSRHDLSDAGCAKDFNAGDVKPWQQDQKGSEGKGWKLWSEVAGRNSYTGRRGSRRD